MKRISYEEIRRDYDYSSKAEADKHKSYMLRNGWRLADEYEIEDGKYKYCVWYTTTRGALA